MRWYGQGAMLPGLASVRLQVSEQVWLSPGLALVDRVADRPASA